MHLLHIYKILHMYNHGVARFVLCCNSKMIYAIYLPFGVASHIYILHLPEDLILAGYLNYGANRMELTVPERRL